MNRPAPLITFLPRLLRGAGREALHRAAGLPRKGTLTPRRLSQMRFIGYIVGGKRFGAGQRKEAEAESKRTGKPLRTWAYKI